MPAAAVELRLAGQLFIARVGRRWLLLAVADTM